MSEYIEEDIKAWGRKRRGGKPNRKCKGDDLVEEYLDTINLCKEMEYFPSDPIVLDFDSLTDIEEVSNNEVTNNTIISVVDSDTLSYLLSLDNKKNTFVLIFASPHKQGCP